MWLWWKLLTISPSVYSRPPCFSVVLHQPGNSCTQIFSDFFQVVYSIHVNFLYRKKCFSVDFNSPWTRSKSGVNKREWALKVGSVHWKPLVLTGQLHVRGNLRADWNRSHSVHLERKYGRGVGGKTHNKRFGSASLVTSWTESFQLWS